MPIVKSGTVIGLPPPNHDGKVSVEYALYNRRSVRSFRPASLTLIEISQLLWSAQGISSPRGYRTAPSAGALYPLEVYIIVGDVQGLPPGIFKYVIGRHALMITAEGDRRDEICRAALHQNFIAKAPLVLLFCTVDDRVTSKYGQRGTKYIFMEVGHAAQNVCLQAVSLGLSTVVIGAFRDRDLATIVNLPDHERPVYMIPVGH